MSVLFIASVFVQRCAVDKNGFYVVRKKKADEKKWYTLKDVAKDDRKKKKVKDERVGWTERAQRKFVIRGLCYLLHFLLILTFAQKSLHFRRSQVYQPI